MPLLIHSEVGSNLPQFLTAIFGVPLKKQTKKRVKKNENSKLSMNNLGQDFPSPPHLQGIKQQTAHHWRCPIDNKYSVILSAPEEQRVVFAALFSHGVLLPLGQEQLIFAQRRILCSSSLILQEHLAAPCCSVLLLVSS